MGTNELDLQKCRKHCLNHLGNQKMRDILLQRRTKAALKNQAATVSNDRSTANFTLCLDPALHIKDLCQDDTVADEEWINTWLKHAKMTRNPQLILIWRLLPQFAAAMLSSRPNNKIHHGFSKNKPKFMPLRNGTEFLNASQRSALPSSKALLQMIRHH